MITYEQVFSWENLLSAYQKASRGKRAHLSTAAFEYRLEDNLISLQEELQNFTYLPGKYKSFYIHEPKRRLISAAPFRDRVIHHALCNIIEPLFERSFIFDSYANRIGKGTHRALDRAQLFSRRYKYFMQCDICQFFPSIDHEQLSIILAKKISDERIMWLCHQILKSGCGVLAEEYEMVYFPGDDLFAALRPRGLPIGNLTSQFWANVYLNGFDHFIQRELRCPAYLRYVDDFLLFGNNKGLFWQWREQIEKKLAHLRLILHKGTQPRSVTEGVPFLGFIIFPQRRRLKRRKGIHYRRRLNHLLSMAYDGQITTQQLNSSILGWVNHVRYGNTIGLRKAVLGAMTTEPGFYERQIDS
jgi:retron-type reverse transcriptase